MTDLFGVLWTCWCYFVLTMTVLHFVEQGFYRVVNWYRLRQWKRAAEVR